MSPAEVYSALSSLKEKKAAGIDGLPNSLLKVAAPGICFSLAALFNNSLLAGKLPRDWKRANVRAIYKRGQKHLPADLPNVVSHQSIGVSAEQVPLKLPLC